MTNIQSVSAAAYGKQTYQASAKTSSRKDDLPKPTAERGEQVELSDTSVNLNKLRETIDAIPDIRIQVVEDIKKRIQFNGYPYETNVYKAVENLIKNKIL